VLLASLFLLSAVTSAGGDAIATPVAPPKTPATNRFFTNELNVAEQLILAGRFGEARARLAELEKSSPQDSQVQFLLAMLDRQDKEYDSAIRRFHRILVNEPKSVRVRLELGRTFYESGDYYNAERQFLFARAGKLPPAVIRNVDRYLVSIRGLKTFALGFSVSIAPDSNLNAGPAIDAVSLYGLPFQLSPDAKAKSGVGLAVAGNAEWAPRVSKQLRFRMGAQAYRNQYRDTQFDDMTVSAYAGPRFNSRRWEFNLLGNAGRRWYGDRTYTDLLGGSADATYYLNTRMGLGAGFNLSHLKFAQNPQQSGDRGIVSASFFYAPTAASLLRASAVAGRQNAQIPAYANDLRQAGLSYVREFKGGITLGLAPSFTHIGYHAPLAAFNATRVDSQYTGQVTLLYRRIDIYGITPRLIYTYTRNESSIPLYRFARSRCELGFTSSF
jgi:outer membrane protein